MIIRLNSNYSWKYTFKVFTYCASIMLKLCWIGLMNMKYSNSTLVDVGALLHTCVIAFVCATDVQRMCKPLQLCPFAKCSSAHIVYRHDFWEHWVMCTGHFGNICYLLESLRMINPIRASRCNKCSFGLLLAVALWSKLKDLGNAHPATLPPLHRNLFTLKLKQTNKKTSTFYNSPAATF